MPAVSGHEPGAHRLLIVTNMWPREDAPGFGSFVAAQVEGLRRAGLHVDVHVIDPMARSGAYVRDIGTIRRLAWSYDLVHAHFGLSGWTAAWQPRPLVVSFCGSDLLAQSAGSGRRGWRGAVTVSLSRWAARRADAIICKSENLRNALPRAADRARAMILPNGVDLARFCPGDRDEARGRLQLPLTERLVLFPYAPTRAEKRIALAEAAVARAGHLIAGVRLLAVDGADPARMPDFYRAADCLLMTSAYEGSPNSVKEALACGLPVVSVDVGDVSQRLAAVEPMAVCEANAEALAAGIHAVLRHGGRVDPTRIAASLDARSVTERLLQLYTRVIGDRARGRQPSRGAPTRVLPE